MRIVSAKRHPRIALRPPGRLIFAVGLLLLLLLAACGGSGETTDNDPSETSSAAPTQVITMMDLPVKVAVTLPVFEEFVNEIGGDNVEVVSLVPPGADPHSYVLTPDDIDRIEDVDFFFVNGLGLDDGIAEQIEQNRKEDAKVVPFAQNTRSPSGPAMGDPDLTAEEAGDNPHLWLDPLLAGTYTEIVADTFVIYDGVNQAFYDSNFRAYDQELTSLANEVRETLQAVPPEGRHLVTFHDAFTMFALRFDLEVTGHAVTSPSDAANEASLAELRQKIRDEGIVAIFAENGFDSSVMDDLGAESGAQVCRLYSDIPADSGHSYADLIRSNANEIVRCLAPE